MHWNKLPILFFQKLLSSLCYVEKSVDDLKQVCDGHTIHLLAQKKENQDKKNRKEDRQI